MAQKTVSANGIDICYESIGDDADPAIVLIMGLGAQLVSWEDGFCDLLAERGLRVIRFDNRDAGLSTKTVVARPKVSFDNGRWRLDGPAPYTLGDMADDTVGLLDALGIDAAHVVGDSLGGMVAQHVAMSHPGRTRTLTVMMSTTGDSRVGAPTADAARALRTRPPRDREENIASTVRMLRTIAGPHFDEEGARRLAAAQFDRSYWPDGSAYQLIASIADGNRTARLASVACPTLVVHGRLDPLIHLSGGEAVAAAIPRARLMVIEEMGHDLSPAFWHQIVGAIGEHTTAGSLTGGDAKSTL